MSSSRSRLSPPAHHIRIMAKQDIPAVLEVWKAIGLHEGTSTINSFMQVDPNGFYVCVDEVTGEILGMCAAIFVADDVAFFGLYAVRPDLQGRGLGIKLWRHCMDHVGQKNAGLYAVPEQLTTYRDKVRSILWRAGFSVQDSRLMCIFESEGQPELADLVQTLGNVIVVPIEESQLEDEVISYDSTILHYSRYNLLKAIFREPDSIAIAALDKFDRKVVGYACMRTNNIGRAMAGPVYADNDAVAELLVSTGIKQFKPAKEAGFLFMPLDSNVGALRLAHKMKLEFHESIPRFFTQQVPEADFNRIYCITTPNFSPF